MKTLTFTLILLIFMACNNKKNEFSYPETKQQDVTDEYFGTKVADPYRWLEDDQSDETKEWVVAQNKFTQTYLEQIAFRQNIFDRLKELWDYPKTSAPSKKGDFYLQYRNNGLQNQSVLYIMDEPDAEGKILIDPNTLSEDGTVSLTATSVSDDYKYMAWQISRGGSDWNEIFIRKIQTGEDLDDHIQWVKFSGVSWYKNGFFYSRYPEPVDGNKLKGENKNSQIYYHELGTSQESDILIYEDPKHPDWMFSADVSHDKKYLFISITESTTGNALLVMDLKSREISPLVEGFNNDFVIVFAENNKAIAYTNYNAPKYQLIEFNLDKPGLENSRILVKETAHVLTGCKYMGGKLLLEYMEDAKSKIYVHKRTGEMESQINIPVGSVSDFTGEVDDTETYFTFTSFTTPSTIYNYNINSGDLKVYKTSEINFDTQAYETKQIFYTSKDGTKVPMFITHKKGLKLDGTNPTLLYGYGGFNISLTPTFSVSRLIWLENNGVLAIPNLRGGGEYGEEWHMAGTKMNKQNVFDDFISAAEYLIDEGFTTSSKISIQGGSNGGLLVGAVANQRPDLFAVALPAVGVMDMLRYHKFTIGRFWATDYGTSDESKDMFEYLLAYSPVHSVKEGFDYPAIMVTTADHDDRVVPAHSFKYAASLQAKVSKASPALIRIDTKAGHGAGKPTDMIIQEYADLWSFAFFNMNIKPAY